jgi:hypothetical protein
MKRSTAIAFVLVVFLLHSAYAQSPIPSTASFDIGFSPGGSALAVVEKAIVAAKSEILMACYELCRARHNSYYADTEIMLLRSGLAV